MDAQIIFEKAMKLDVGDEFVLLCATKGERNNFVSDLRQQKRSFSNDNGDVRVSQIVIERIELKKGKFGVKLSKCNPLPTVGLIKRTNGTIEQVDLEDGGNDSEDEFPELPDV